MCIHWDLVFVCMYLGIGMYIFVHMNVLLVLFIWVCGSFSLCCVLPVCGSQQCDVLCCFGAARSNNIVSFGN